MEHCLISFEFIGDCYDLSSEDIESDRSRTRTVGKCCLCSRTCNRDGSGISRMLRHWRMLWNGLLLTS